MITVRNFETITSRWEDGIKMYLQENVFYSHPSQYNTINAVTSSRNVIAKYGLD